LNTHDPSNEETPKQLLALGPKQTVSNQRNVTNPSRVRTESFKKTLQILEVNAVNH
jgi:hypothetical protein